MFFFKTFVVCIKSLCYYVFMKNTAQEQKHKAQSFYMFLMMLAAFFWGTTFVAQSKGAEHVGAYTYLAGRSWISFFLMALMIQGIGFWQKKKKDHVPATKARRRHIILGSLCCGFFLFAASAAQQVGIAYTTTAKSGFLTAMYVVLVPVFSLFFGKKVRPLVFACVGLSVVGLYLLCMKDGYSLGFGDMITLVSALLFTFQILCVSHFSHGVYGPTLAAGMFLVEAVLATVGMLWTEKLSLVSLRAATGSILYAAVFSGCVAYTLQVVVQKHLSATLASIAMCCESVFSALAGWIVLGQTLSGRELSGCVIIFVSILTASLVSTEKA